MNIGIKIKEIREKNNKTIQEIASVLEIAKITYNHYETQEKIIPIERLNTLCNFYEIPIDYIFGITSTQKYNVNSKIIDNSLVGKRLKEFRKENKLTQVKLAQLLNTVHPTIVNYENGKNLIPTAFLYTICKKYNISADYLLGKTDSPKYLK